MSRPESEAKARELINEAIRSHGGAGVNLSSKAVERIIHAVADDLEHDPELAAQVEAGGRRRQAT